MKKGILGLSLLFLLTLASQGSWCAAETSTRISADHHLRPHLQVQELHGKKEILQIQSPRKLGHGLILKQHGVSVVETKRPRRMAIGHKGGSVGGGGTSAATGGGGGAAARPHNTKNGAAALPVPATTSLLTLAFTCAVVLSAFGF
ncbi:uncharacterized protein LOC133898358 [Phragmites australis]|uniref:uncharacterized protein LOC133898358 n=1 Tax=Phragmites australis TaxID=29695 RepID=UPI002D76D788|nr:uncharacterized protein LOC133898358 [Phragmites australis]